MSRRTTLDGIFKQSLEELATANFEDEKEQRDPAGPVKSMALSLGKMEDETRALQAALKSGQHIQELDPHLIEPSFVRDRIEDIVFVEGDPFLQSIAENGQEVPILIRPHPEKEGRYQVAYGHRRLKAALVLGIKVRAVVREFDDAALVIAQGIENSERENLSYVERAAFALSLEQRGFARTVIMRALSTDKTELSKMISVASAIPPSVILSIGSARGIGRRKWMTFATAYDASKQRKVEACLRSDEFIRRNSDQRFELVLSILTRNAEGLQNTSEWIPKNGGPVVGTIKADGKSFVLSLKSSDAALFGDFLAHRLDELYGEYLVGKGD